MQKTFVEVNEEGTIADRPFFYVIEDSVTRELLFLGGLRDPR